jgi:hypothetical protein
MPLHPPPLGDSNNRPNGNRWLTLDENSKYAYIVGFLEGLFQGHCFTTWGLPGGQANDPSYENAVASYKDHWNRFVARTTFRQFFCGLDNFYAETKNRNIEIRSAMWIVMNEIAGLPPGPMHAMIEAWRQKNTGDIDP